MYISIDQTYFSVHIIEVQSQNTDLGNISAKMCIDFIFVGMAIIRENMFNKLVFFFILEFFILHDMMFEYHGMGGGERKFIGSSRGKNLLA